VEITRPVLNRYVEARQQQEPKNATINRELSALMRMLNLGKANDKVRFVPVFPHLEENNIRQGFLPDGADKKIIEACPELWFRAYMEIATNYAWRKGELLGLRGHQVDLLARMFRLGYSKNGKAREVKMTESMYQLLRLCVAGKKPTDYVFTRDNGKRVIDFRKSWQNACCAAGFGRFTCKECGSEFTAAGSRCPKCKGRLRYHGLVVHDLRRTGRRNLRRSGVQDDVAKLVGGWESDSCAERYNIIDYADMVDAAHKMEAFTRAQAENGDSSGTVGVEKLENAELITKSEVVN
jgi:integrase